MTALLLVLVFGISTTFWSLVGVGRALDSVRRRHFAHHPRRRFAMPRSLVRRPRSAAHASPTERPRAAPRVAGLTPADVAVLVAAHNEELVIADTIRAASQLVDAGNIHIISDGSKDSTATVARSAGANVLQLSPNRGKAGALAAGIEHFDLCRRFEVVLLLDADTHLAPDYLATGLPLFDDPGVVAVAGRARTIDDTLCVNPSVRGAWWSPLAPRTLRVRPSGLKGR